MSVATHKVTFHPDGKTVQIEHGKSLLYAAQRANVYVNSLCGGDGICGRCRVILNTGQIEETPHSLLSREDVQRGYVLACMAYPRSDMVVDVPVESRIEGPQIVAGLAPERFRGLRRTVRAPVAYAHDPLIRKLYLELTPPSIDDATADLERLYQEIRRRRNAPIMQMGLTQTRRVARTLRDNQWRVTATIAQRGGTTEVTQIEDGDSSGRNYALAVDVGTTTVVAHLVDLVTSGTVGAEAMMNPQIQYGEDVTSRMVFAEQRDGLEALHHTIVAAINDLVSILAQQHEIRRQDVTAVVCAGNTPMTHLLMNIDPYNIRREPYVPVVVEPPPLRAVEVGIRVNPRGLLYVLPGVSGYVGSDVTADVLVSGMAHRDKLAMLIDVGTNGEVVVGNREWLICTSASAGPAFEGGEVRCGMRATRGAIERITISKDTCSVAFSTIGRDKPRGICGSGILCLVAELRRTHIIDRAGKFNTQKKNCPRIRTSSSVPEFVICFRAETALDQDLVITEADIGNIIRSKAAVFAATRALLRKVELEVNTIKDIYVAGGFGNYLDVERAVRIGLLPDVPIDRIHYIGNGSIQGAKLAIQSTEAARDIERIAGNMTYVNLSADHMFMDEYIQASFLPHTDARLFPSVGQ